MRALCSFWFVFTKPCMDFPTVNHFESSTYSNSFRPQHRIKFSVLFRVAATHFHLPVVLSFILQYSFAMYTPCIHHYMNHSSSASATIRLDQHS
ncbi:MAG: hypothetical protein [Circular genetic element sp.]|nr:MAG: hypothetical protein [Circular genetic element sp.]